MNVKDLLLKLFLLDYKNIKYVIILGVYKIFIKYKIYIKYRKVLKCYYV